MEYVYSDYIDSEGNVYPTVGENIRHGKNKSAVKTQANTTTVEKTEFFGYTVGRVIVDIKNSVIVEDKNDVGNLLTNGVLKLKFKDGTGLSVFSPLGIWYDRYVYTGTGYIYADFGCYDDKTITCDLRQVFIRNNPDYPKPRVVVYYLYH